MFVKNKQIKVISALVFFLKLEHFIPVSWSWLNVWKITIKKIKKWDKITGWTSRGSLPVSGPETWAGFYQAVPSWTVEPGESSSGHRVPASSGFDWGENTQPLQEGERHEVTQTAPRDDPEEDPGVVRHDAEHQHVGQSHLQDVEHRLEQVQQPAGGTTKQSDGFNTRKHKITPDRLKRSVLTWSSKIYSDLVQKLNVNVSSCSILQMWPIVTTIKSKSGMWINKMM